MTKTIKQYAKEKGLAIVEAKHAVKLLVTRDDVKKGRRNNPASCGFALCAKRMHKVENAFFLRSTAYLQKGNQLVRYVLPGSMRTEIVAFDRGKAMEPGVYEMKRTRPSQTIKGIRARLSKYPSKQGPAGKRRRVIHRTTGIRTGIVAAA